MIKKRGYFGGIYFLIILSFILLIGCSVPTMQDSNKEKKETTAEESKIPKAPKKLEDMIAQDAGKLVEKYLDPEIEVAGPTKYFENRNFIDEEFYPAIEKELVPYFEKHPVLTSNEVYDYLVYQLGSGQYKSYYKQLINFEHGHVMPELPDEEDEIEVIKKQQKTNVVILMDASGSMKASVTGGVKMDLAKETIKKFTAEMEDDVNVSLLAYGHIGSGKDSDKAKSCQAIDTVYPLSSYDSTSFDEALNSFNASGWTPLAGAIEKANELLSSYNKEEYKNIIFIVSDGIETCNGDPVAAAKKLNESNIEARVNIIGFDVDDEGQKQLKQVAEAGGGKYATVRDKSELEDIVLKKWRPSSYLQIANTNGILLHEMVDQMERLSAISDPLYSASEFEANRIKHAAHFLEEKELISTETATAVERQAEKLRKLRTDHFQAISDEKDAEAQRARDEINDKVDAWKEKWFKVLENE